MSRFSLVCVLALGLIGCPMAYPQPGPTLDVDAELSSVILGDDCASAARPGPGLIAGDCAEDSSFCGCQQSSIHLALTAHEGEEAPVEIISVEIFDQAGELVDALDARNPRTFDGSTFSAWDETIAAGEALHVSYDTDAPDWATFEGGRYGGARYTVRVIIRIDGVDRTLELRDVTPEAPIVT